MPKLREILNARPKDRVIAAPGVYDMISLRMASAMGFEALYMTGYGAVASLLAPRRRARQLCRRWSAGSAALTR